MRSSIIMLQGTASDVGKSVITTALCRIFTQDGWNTAPFKSQNMANNSYVTPDGREIGRAQGVQAEACGKRATTDMNPILIKPVRDMHSQIVVHGQPYAQMSAWDYRHDFLPQARPLVMEALNRLRDQHDMVVMEGAGSPAEINLKDRDIVNMNLAGWADAPVLLVADIDRGGVFAAIVGTLELLEPHERSQVKGFIINKFRGDLALLQPGLDWLQQRTGIPVIGVLPYEENLHLEAEDSVALQRKSSRPLPGRELDIVIIHYPRISNFTDFDLLEAEPDVSVRYVDHPDQLGTPDVIILPGTKDTLGDLEFLQDRGLAECIKKLHSLRSVQLIGICGGYQMLGKQLNDPAGHDSPVPRLAEGLGLLPLSTIFASTKTTVHAAGQLNMESALRIQKNNELQPAIIPVQGYEIHMGTTTIEAGASVQSLFHLYRLTDESDSPTSIEDGCILPDGSVWGTYLHGVFDNDHLRRSWLNSLRQLKGLEPLRETIHGQTRRQEAFDRLADTVRKHLDMERIYAIAAGR
ncbi:cobyric acid synthase [Paenibacillus bovis]|uniref:Cobyric acid synthase n=1 Tax=Paenibacillus bovis TaxID=1616788 RepID=A0A172ZEY0_9BACL|nr:cobyric acid synthase [Paenibacillus bovis]ANF96079.1 cobyric acid synthase CobQ [Paenibacillus bovis]